MINCFNKVKDVILNKKIFYDVLVIFLLFVPILITLDGHIKIAGTILTGIPIVFGIISILLYQKKKRVKYLIIAALFIINQFFVTNYKGQFEFIKLLFIFFISFDLAQDMEFLSKIKKYFEKYSIFITVIIAIIIIANVVAVFSGNAASSKYASAWRIDAIQGVFTDPNQAAYRLSAIIVYIMFLIKAKKNNNIVNFLLLVVCELLILKTGARTPTLLGIALGMIAIYFMKNDMLALYKKHKKISIIAGVILIIAIAIYLPKTSFIQKMNTPDGKAFDNGRSAMRNVDWGYYVNSDIGNMLFGTDTNIIKAVNFKVVRGYVWSHCDIMQILLQFGAIMLVIYFETIFSTMLFHLEGEKKFDKFIIILLNLVLLFVGLYNGLFFHPRFVVTIPIILMVHKLYEEKEIKE